MQIYQKSTCLKWTNELFGHYYRAATLSTFYLTVSGNPQYNSKMPKLINKNAKNSYA